MIKRALLVTTGIITGAIFALPLILFGILNAGNAAGLLFAAALILYGVFFNKVNIATISLWRKKTGRAVLSVVALITAVALIFTAVMTVKMAYAANSPSQEETTAVVLGCKVNPAGPSLMLTTRLKATLKYLMENPDAKCVLSGGKGADEPMSEAQAMAEWLTLRGVEESRLYIEDKSTSTRENLRFSKELIEKEGLPPEITIITNEFHQYRAKQIAIDCGIESYSFSAKTPLYLLPTYYIREIGGILVELAEGVSA